MTVYPEEYDPFAVYSAERPSVDKTQNPRANTLHLQPKKRVYGTKAALTIEATYRKGNESEEGSTVSIEIAPRIGEKVQWSDKVTVQLSASELPTFCAVCLGYLPKCSFQRPGKYINVTRQKDKMYISAKSASTVVYGVPVPIGEAYHLSNLALSQLMRSSFTSNGDLVIASIKGVAALHRLSE